MILSDRTIKEMLASGKIVIDPLEPGNIRSASVDVRLGGAMVFHSNPSLSLIDTRLNPRKQVGEMTVPLDKEESFFLPPGGFIFITTLERVELCEGLVAEVFGKSSLMRLGLSIHPGSIESHLFPGWKGYVTFGVQNLGNLSLRLYRGMKIAQIAFEEVG